MGKQALIIGISGQDGSYLAQFLLQKGYRVFGTSRQSLPLSNHVRLGIAEHVRLLSPDLHDSNKVRELLAQSAPDEIYNLAGQSSVSKSFEQPLETFQSIAHTNLVFLEALRQERSTTPYFYAGSSECFGDNPEPATESTPFAPTNPYAFAKASAFWQTATYRQNYGLFACTGILFNHESPLRPDYFVTHKIIRAVCQIAQGSKELLSLGNLDIARDWGYAPDYVDAMWRMLQQAHAEDIILATGITITLRDFVSIAFQEIGKDWQEYVCADATLLRPSDIRVSKAHPQKAEICLQWRATSTPQDLIRKLIAAEMEQCRI